MNALRNASLRGVDVRIITPHIPDKKIVLNLTRSYYKELLNTNIKIYEYKEGFIHAKNFISDDKVGVVGTINLDYRSLVHHYECGVYMVNSPSILDIKEDFINTMNESIEIPKDFKLNIFTWSPFLIPYSTLGKNLLFKYTQLLLLTFSNTKLLSL